MTVVARERLYTFGTDVWTCAGCYSPPHETPEGRLYLYRYALQEGRGTLWSAAVCCHACIAPAHRRIADRAAAAPLSDLAQRLRLKDLADFATERRASAEAARDARLAAIRALGEDAVAQHMARFIVATVAGSDSCSRSDLKSAGFTADELARLGPAAVARAAAQHPDLRG